MTLALFLVVAVVVGVSFLVALRGDVAPLVRRPRRLRHQGNLVFFPTPHDRRRLAGRRAAMLSRRAARQARALRLAHLYHPRQNHR